MVTLLVLGPPAIHISELCLACGTAHIGFVELEGKPSSSLRGLSLVFFSGKEGKAHAIIPLQGSVGTTGLLVFVLDGEHGYGESDRMDLVWGLSSNTWAGA